MTTNKADEKEERVLYQPLVVLNTMTPYLSRQLYSHCETRSITHNIYTYRQIHRGTLYIPHTHNQPHTDECMLK